MKRKEYTVEYFRGIVYRMIGTSGKLEGRCLTIGKRTILLPIKYGPLPRELALAVVQNIRKDYGGLLA